MIDRLFELPAIGFLAVCGMAGLLVGVAVGVARADGTAQRRGIEALALAVIGGFLARSFVSLLLSAADDSRGAGLLVGWGLFLWPGLLDSVARIFGGNLLTEPGELLFIGSVVGALTGLMAGARRIHPPDPSGGVQFVLDTTWGLAGSTNGCLLHLFNSVAGTHAEDVRSGAHRYPTGFHLKKEFAFTQGPVMSELKDGPAKNELDRPPRDALYRHEYTHVRQNRWFGPFFLLTYLGWNVVMFIPAVVLAAVKRDGLGARIQGHCYFSNPWEAWGYKVQERRGGGLRTDHAYPMWSDPTVIGLSLVFFPPVVTLLLVAAFSAWL